MTNTVTSIRRPCGEPGCVALAEGPAAYCCVHAHVRRCRPGRFDKDMAVRGRLVTVTVDGWMAGSAQDIAAEVAGRLEDRTPLQWSLGSVVVEIPGEGRTAPSVEALDRDDAGIAMSSDWPHVDRVDEDREP